MAAYPDYIKSIVESTKIIYKVRGDNMTRLQLIESCNEFVETIRQDESRDIFFDPKTGELFTEDNRGYENIRLGICISWYPVYTDDNEYLGYWEDFATQSEQYYTKEEATEFWR